MLLDEFALVPDIFDPTTYSSRELATASLSWLKEPLLSEGLVRDLRDGEWSNFMKSQISNWENSGKELFVKLQKQNRIYQAAPAGPVVCTDGATWTQEALASHKRSALTGIITTTDLASYC